MVLENELGAGNLSARSWKVLEFARSGVYGGHNDADADAKIYLQ